MPSSPSAPPDFLSRRPFAHRGLHGAGVVENSRAAWDAAVAGGHGIECDVQASADGIPHVFHDDRLDRLTGETGPVSTRSAATLAAVRLTGTAETVPTLAEMLSRLAGHAALLIEIKSKGELNALCKGVARDLAGYTGEAAIMSFDPRACRWFRRHAPSRIRGLVLTAQDEPGLWGRLKRRVALWWSDPHFIACDVRDLPLPLATRFRATGRPVLSWTVRTAADRATAVAHADQIIFEQPA